MRFKNDSGNFKIYAVSGTNTIAFAIDCDESDMENLLGFMVEKEYVRNNKTIRVTVMGFKVFKERIENPTPGALYSTYDNPIQSFTWEDFSAYPGSEYTYHFTPLFDDPLNIRRGDIISIAVKTEPAWKQNDHSVFFNRGTASSQAYAVKFSNKPPEQIGDAAFNWLSRGLKEAIYKFIDETPNNQKLYCCFYEFRYDGVLQRLRDAADRGVKVNIIYDAKENEHFDNEKNKWVESFPKVENEKAINVAKLDINENVTLIKRERNKSYISHNKFMVRVDNNDIAQSVWTGSTNISQGGIFGQTNVGHAFHDSEAAGCFLQYWKELSKDPSSKDLKAACGDIQADLDDVNDIPEGVSCIFSPRSEMQMLQFYAELLDSAESCACITLAFGVHQKFVDALSNNDANNALTFLLLEKDAEGLFDYIYQNNVVKAVGSDIPGNSVYKWVKETDTGAIKLNHHVRYLHTKFLLKDPLSENPITVTGSANFSEAATDKNDENMVIINGNRRVADIYFTEFLRIFNHYYFRWIVNKMLNEGTLDADNPAFLKPNNSWTQQYKPGKFKRKRVEIFSNMYIEDSDS